MQGKKHILIIDGDARQALPFLKSYKLAGHQITIACYRKLSPGYFSRYPDKRLISPECDKDPDHFREFIFDLLKTGKYDVMLPFGHHTTRFCVEYKKEIEQYAIVPVPDYETFMRAFDKGLTMAFCMKNGIPCPTTYFPDEESLESIISRAPFPLWLKPRIGIGAIGQRRLDTPEILLEQYPLYRQKYGPMIIQDCIPHDNAHQLVCHTFLDAQSKLCACMVSAKPRFFPLRGGTSTVLVSIDRPDVAAYCKRLFEGIGLVGIADADIIVDPRDGQAKVMEINPRVSCSIKIGFATGIDYADMWLRLALGLPITPKLDYKLDLHLRNLCQDILWYLYSDRQAKKNTYPPFLKFFGRNVIYQTISLDDPFTFFGFVLNMLGKYHSAGSRSEKWGT